LGDYIGGSIPNAGLAPTGAKESLELRTILRGNSIYGFFYVEFSIHGDGLIYEPNQWKNQGWEVSNTHMMEKKCS